MRILLIGNTSLQNDAITKILLSQEKWKVSQVHPSKIIENDPPFGEDQFFLSLIDLCSLEYDFDTIIKTIRNSELATYLVVLYDDHSDHLLQKLKKAGADTCVSVNSKTNQFVDAILKFCNS